MVRWEVELMTKSKTMIDNTHLISSHFIFYVNIFVVNLNDVFFLILKLI